MTVDELSGSSLPFLNPRPDHADQETMTVRAPARHGRLVEPDGLAALRLAIAISRDPGLGWSREAMAFRSLPRARAMTTMPAPAEPAPAAPSIPSPTPPSEPTGELATVMEIVTRAQGGDSEAF